MHKGVFKKTPPSLFPVASESPQEPFVFSSLRISVVVLQIWG